MNTYVRPQLALFIKEEIPKPSITCYKLPNILKIIKDKIQITKEKL